MALPQKAPPPTTPRRDPSRPLAELSGPVRGHVPSRSPCAFPRRASFCLREFRFPPPPSGECRLPSSPFGQGTSKLTRPCHRGTGAPQKPSFESAEGFPRAPVATPFVGLGARQVQGTPGKQAPSGTFEAPPADALAASSLPGFEDVQRPHRLTWQGGRNSQRRDPIRGSSDPGCCRQSFILENLASFPRKTAPFPSREEMARPSKVAPFLPRGKRCRLARDRPPNSPRLNDWR